MLNINNLSVFVDRKNIVKGVSLTIRPGEIHALMGPNGSGKSSLAMALMGHPRYTVAKEEGRRKREEGPTITLDGEDIADKTPDERARMGLFLAMQYPVSIGGVTVEQLLRQIIAPKSETNSKSKIINSKHIDVLQFRKELEKLAKKVGVKPELLHRSLNVGFSGGEKKRLEILQMLVLKPKYAILDETDSGLDVDALRTIAKAVKSFADQQLTINPAKRDLASPDNQQSGILVITHYARLLHHLKPNFIHIMKDGKIIESGGKEVGERVEKEGYVSFRANRTI